MPTITRAAPIKIKLNATVCKGVEPPTDTDRIYFYDTDAPGLALCVTGKGTKTFYWYGRVAGRPHRHKLGRFPAVSVEQARKRALAFGGKVAAGETPRTIKRASKGKLSLGEAFEAYKAMPTHRTKRPKSAKTIDGYQRQYDTHLAKWADRGLDKITAADVEALHNRIGTEAPYQANRVLALLSAIYNALPKLGYAPVANPATGIERFPEQARERFIEEDELPGFFAACEAHPGPINRDWLLFALFTGARRDNVSTARWEQIHMERRLWTIPQTKGGDELRVPLSDAAMLILSRRERPDSGEGFIFPGRGKAGHIAEPKMALNTIVKAANIDHLRPHDLRHTLATYATKAGVNYIVVKAMLGHKPDVRDVTAVYARADLAAIRDGFDKAAEKMIEVGKWSAMTPKPKRRKRKASK